MTTTDQEYETVCMLVGDSLLRYITAASMLRNTAHGALEYVDADRSSSRPGSWADPFILDFVRWASESDQPSGFRVRKMLDLLGIHRRHAEDMARLIGDCRSGDRDVGSG